MRWLRHAVRKIVRQLPHRRGLKSHDPFVIIRHLVKRETPVILDVGAHIGQTSARFRTLFPNARIHAFEPSPAAFARLSAAVAGDRRITSHQIAVADSAGTATLHINENSQTNSILTSDARAHTYWGDNLYETQSVVEARTETLDRWCKTERIAHIDILKVDVQGAEYAVLQGAAELLRRQAVDVLYIELITAPTYVGQHKLHEYLWLLDSYGYTLFNLYHLSRKNGRLIQADVLFVSGPLLATLESRPPK